jgi:hypothetical protein
MRFITANPEISTGQVSDTVGISNGSAIYVLTTFISKGLIKLDNFKNRALEKSLLTQKFIKHTRKKFEVLKTEIQALEEEAAIASEVTPVQRGEK